MTGNSPRHAAGAGPLLRVLRLAGPLSGRMLLAAGAGALAAGCGIALLAVSGFLLARASQHPDIAALSVAVVAVRGLSIGRGAFRYAERLAAHDVAFRVLAQVRVAIWRRLEALAPAGLPAFRSADLLTRLVSDVNVTQEVFIRGVTPPLAAGLAGAGAVLACLMVLVPAGLVLALGLLAGGVAVPLAGLAVARAAAQRAAPARGQLSAAMGDVLAGAADLHAFGGTGVALDRVQAANRKLTTLAGRSATAAGLGSGLATLVAGLTLWGVLVAGVAAVGAGALTRVPLAVLTLTALAAFEAVTALSPAALAVGQASASARRVGAVLDAPAPVSDPAVPRPLPAGPVTVSLREARVRYSPAGPLAIDRVSLDLPPGRRVALVGPNGAGKSTVAAVLLRFRELSGGSVTLDGHDLAGYRADDVRTVIGGLPQDPYLFDASIAENLRIARPAASDKELTRVLAKVGLLGWIGSLPLGAGTQVGPDGVAISGGQRQRIALARALLADPAILILDEPGAHLDPQARRSWTTDLLTATKGRAVLLITHDLDGLDQVDEIIVLDRGRVAERGTHAELLAVAGAYQRMRGSAEPGKSALRPACGADPVRGPPSACVCRSPVRARRLFSRIRLTDFHDHRVNRPLEHQAHLDQVPELTIGPPDVAHEPPLLHEAELPVQGDRGVVMREDAERQLVQAARLRPVDSGSYQRRSHSTAAPADRHHHPDLAEAHPARIHAQLADDFAVGQRDQRALDRPARRQLWYVDRWLGRDPVPFLRDRGEKARQRITVAMLGGPN